MDTKNRSIAIITAVLLCLSIPPSQAATGSWGSSASPGQKQGPMPLPGLEALDEYHRQLLYASRNIEEGDYGSARENLAKAMEIRRDDPRLYELLGIACDADRDAAEAFKSFKRAGEIYLSLGDRDRAVKMLGWLRTFTGRSDEIHDFEDRVGELRD